MVSQRRLLCIVFQVAKVANSRHIAVSLTKRGDPPVGCWVQPSTLGVGATTTAWTRAEVRTEPEGTVTVDIRSMHAGRLGPDATARREQVLLPFGVEDGRMRGGGGLPGAVPEHRLVGRHPAVGGAGPTVGVERALGEVDVGRDGRRGVTRSPFTPGRRSRRSARGNALPPPSSSLPRPSTPRSAPARTPGRRRARSRRPVSRE